MYYNCDTQANVSMARTLYVFVSPFSISSRYVLCMCLYIRRRNAISAAILFNFDLFFAPHISFE